MTLRDQIMLAGYLLASTLGIIGAAFSFPWGITLLVASGFLLTFVLLLALPVAPDQPGSQLQPIQSAPIQTERGSVVVRRMNPMSMSRGS